MKTSSQPGEFAFRALYNDQGAWLITDSYFFTKEEVEKFFTDRVPAKFLWPIEYDELNRCVYVPTKEQLEEYT